MTSLSNVLYACFQLGNTLIICTSNTLMEGQVHLLVIHIQMIGNPMVVTQVPQGDMYKVNKMGPSMLPLGTPNMSGTGSEWAPSVSGSPIMTCCDLWVRYEHIQLRAVPETPKWWFSQLSKIEWLTVSKAANRSIRTRCITSCLSMAWWMSDLTLSSAVSVLWNAPYAKYSDSTTLWLWMWSVSWSTTTLIINLPVIARLDTGL